MIKVDRPAGSAPTGLTRAAARELRKNRAMLKADPKATLSFGAYSSPAVRTALASIFGRKCAFCESLILGTQSGDIEHYRPKGEVAIADPKTGKFKGVRGYYWLAGKWSNLLMACADCNRPRTQPDHDGQDRVIGKFNFFPVASEASRATGPGRMAGEQALLLHPCHDDPSEHLSFREDGGVEPSILNGMPSAKGIATIRYCGLSRLELLQMRARHKRFVLAAIRHTVSALEAGHDPGADLDDLVSMLDRRDGAYVAFTRMLVRKHLGPYLQSLNLDAVL